MDPYVGQIIQIGCGFAPQGFLPCDGTLFPISDFDALFTLIGTTYGGDGVTTFAVPDLTGRVPIHAGRAPSGTPYNLGQTGGTAGVMLTVQQIPAHGHSLNVVTGKGSGTATPSAQACVADEIDRKDAYSATTGSLTTMNGSIAPTGGSNAHNNMQPVVANLFCIAYIGLYPSPS